MTKTVKIAIEGCGHGELSAIYSAIPEDTELLIICGDFQALRNETDLQCINVPSKYKKLGDFHEYYKGEKKAPLLTIFVGGNHESSSYLTELKFGGWVAPNIYYLGEFGVVWFKGLRIAGISGIFNSYSFSRNEINDEKLPYTDKTLRSVYHVTPKVFLKMYMMGNNGLDVAISHDWPSEIEKHGDLKLLLKKKPFFKSDIANGKLGSPLNKTLLYSLKPRYWFSAHLHVKFSATITHKNYSVTNKNPDELELDMDDDFEEHSEKEHNNDIVDNSDSNVCSRETKRIKLEDIVQTKFLALDKCLPGRAFLECIQIPILSDHPSINCNELYYDKRSISTNRVIESFIQSNKESWLQIRTRDFYNPENLLHYRNLKESIDLGEKEIDSDMKVPDNFRVISPTSNSETKAELKYWINNQTLEYCKKFNIPYIPPS